MRILHIVDIVELLVIITGKVIYKQSLLTNLSVNTKKRGNFVEQKVHENLELQHSSLNTEWKKGC